MVLCLIPNPKAGEACKLCGKARRQNFQNIFFLFYFISESSKDDFNLSSSNRNKLSVSEMLMMPTQNINYLPKSGKENHYIST